MLILNPGIVALVPPGAIVVVFENEFELPTADAYLKIKHPAYAKVLLPNDIKLRVSLDPLPNLLVTRTDLDAPAEVFAALFIEVNPVGFTARNGD